MRLARLVAIASTFLLPVVAMAQSSPGLFTGQVPTASQWNGYFSVKADATGGILTSPTLINPVFGGTSTGTLNAIKLGDGLTIASTIIDVGVFGAACDGFTDDSPAFQAAIAASVPGGVVRVPSLGHSCVLKEGITLGSASQSGVSLVGSAGAYWPSYYDNTESDWTQHGSWLRCDDVVNACITVNGAGSTIDGLNFWYTQPTPPGDPCGTTCTFSHSWTPTTYPYTISIQNPQVFNHFRNIFIVNATHCIDIEGPSTGVASFYTYFEHMQLGCFNIGTKFGKIDNVVDMHDINYDVLWYQANPNVWGYMEGDSGHTGNKISWDMYYLSDLHADGIQFYQDWASIRATDASVGSGLGTVTFGGEGLQLSNITFNQVCQGIILASSTTHFTANFSNVLLNVDPQTSAVSGQCGANWPYAFNLNSDNANVKFTNLDVLFAQTILQLGGGTGGFAHLANFSSKNYSAYVNAGAAFKVNTGAALDANGDMNALFTTNSSAGPHVTGTPNWPSTYTGLAIEGASTTDRTLGFLDSAATGAGGGFSLTRWQLRAGTTGNLNIDRFNSSGVKTDTPITISATTGVPFFGDGLAGTLPTSCSGQPTGTFWNNSSVVNVCP